MVTSKTLNFLIIIASNFGAGGIMSIFWLYMSTFVEKNQYGEIGYFISIATVSYAIASLGLGSVVIVYGAKKEKVLAPAYSLGLISSLIISIIIYIFTQNLYVVFLIFGMFIFQMTTTDLVSKKLYITRSKYKIARSILTLGSAIPLFYLFDLNGIILGYIIGTLPALKGLYSFIKNEKQPISILKPKIRFFINNWLIDLGDKLFWWGDKIVIGSLFGFNLLASYQLTSQYLFMLYNIPFSVFVYLLPQEAEGLKNKKIKIFAITLSILLVVASIIVIPYVIPIFIPQYEDAILPIQIMSFSMISLTIAYIIQSQMIGKEITKPIVIGTALQILTYFPLLIILGIDEGIIGIAKAFLISSMIKPVFYVIILNVFKK